MRVGIDSYCYHRFFGEVYSRQRQPARAMSLEDFLARAKQLAVDGVSIESCFVPRQDDPGYIASVRARLDDYGFDRVYAWGHPDGLAGGTDAVAYAGMIAALATAEQLGATVMRIVGSSLMFRFDDHQAQIRRLVVQLREAVKVAEDHGIKLAIENHIDFTAKEILQLINEVGSPYLGVNFDTGNFARLLDDPLKGMELLAKHVLATHVKDLRVNPAAAVDDWFFLSSTPVGAGFIDNLKLARLLKQAGYQGFLAMELDFLHPDFNDDEDAAVAASVTELRRISRVLEDEPC